MNLRRTNPHYREFPIVIAAIAMVAPTVSPSGLLDRRQKPGNRKATGLNVVDYASAYSTRRATFWRTIVPRWAILIVHMDVRPGTACQVSK